MNSPAGPYVVVGVDGSPLADQAVDWAADEAALRGAVLRIGHSWSPAPYRLPEADRRDLAEQAEKAAADLLAAAERRALARRPGLAVMAEPLADEPAAGLLELARDADLLVVGSKGTSRFAALMLGSVSQSLAGHARVPVAVVRPGEDGTTAPGSRPVVLGVAPDEAPGPVEFAFAQARRRGVPLRAVRSWLYPQSYPGLVAVPTEEAADRDREETEQTEVALAGARAAYPQVAVTVEVGLAEPAPALVEASRDASVVVVGARRDRRRFSMPLGPVTHRVLEHALSPVAVVPV
ncbi:universal stress protein [Streptomyces sp. ICBB 8177]|uniref:universal stress protein n=1 Tax=Streptomyces sp. ICBB 8177 TaxID=563922 RepID=UPI000D675669|nr:universal stress protein [Streptomyces sp. ICBB 8177]PWI45713.1 hypothetical protein CK485_00605 [Streptomyces sp. ICBB 8177]